MKITPLILTACLLVCLGCDIDDIDLSGLGEILTVSVTTVGSDMDPNGYMLSITGRQDEPIGINETKTFTVIANTVTVTLSDVAANCVAAQNSVTIDLNNPATVAFFVECT